MAQSGSASALGAEGRRFKSCCPDHLSLRPVTAAPRGASRSAPTRCRRRPIQAKRIDAIDELVAGVDGELGDALANAPWLLADSITMCMLDDIAQRRAHK